MSVVFKHRIHGRSIGDVAILSLHQSVNFGLCESCEKVCEVARGVMGVLPGGHLHVAEGRLLEMAGGRLHFLGKRARILSKDLVQPVIMMWRVGEEHPTEEFTCCGESETGLEVLKEGFGDF